MHSRVIEFEKVILGSKEQDMVVLPYHGQQELRPLFNTISRMG